VTNPQPTAISAPRRVAAEIQRGLSRPETHLPCKFLYDEAGSELFERICALPEYYLTRTELRIMTDGASEICAALGPRVRLVEFGSGSSTKTRLLLDALEDPAAYVPVDIAAGMLSAAVRAMRARYPRLLIEPVCTDYAEPFALPPAPAATARTVCYFPGSTIGNFTDEEARSFLRRIAAVCGEDGGLLVGADLRKDVGVLLAAYNDRGGVTARFNRNLLRHVAAATGADFVPEQFEHRAVWNGAQGRIEMQLVSLQTQVVRVGGAAFPFRAGEVLTTEYSHKYTLAGFAELAARGGFVVERVWTDPDRWFSVQLLRAAAR
jgi:dimethylhistidine N-methyltransferase